MEREFTVRGKSGEHGLYIRLPLTRGVLSIFIEGKPNQTAEILAEKATEHIVRSCSLGRRICEGEAVVDMIDGAITSAVAKCGQRDKCPFGLGEEGGSGDREPLTPDEPLGGLEAEAEFAERA